MHPSLKSVDRASNCRCAERSGWPAACECYREHIQKKFISIFTLSEFWRTRSWSKVCDLCLFESCRFFYHTVWRRISVGFLEILAMTKNLRMFSSTFFEVAPCSGCHKYYLLVSDIENILIHLMRYDYWQSCFMNAVATWLSCDWDFCSVAFIGTCILHHWFCQRLTILAFSWHFHRICEQHQLKIGRLRVRMTSRVSQIVAYSRLDLSCPLPAAKLATHPPISCPEDFNTQLKLVLIHLALRDEPLGFRGRENEQPAQGCYVMIYSEVETWTQTTWLESSLLTAS